MHNPLSRCASISARVRSNKAAAPCAQKSSSINLDTQGCEGQDHVEVLPFKAILPLPSPRQFVEQLSSASSAKRAVRPRLVFLRPRRAYLLSDVQDCTPRTAAVPRRNTRARRASCEERFFFSQKGEHTMSE